MSTAGRTVAAAVAVALIPVGVSAGVGASTAASGAKPVDGVGPHQEHAAALPAGHGGHGGSAARAALRVADGTRVGTVAITPYGKDGSRVHVSLRVPAGATPVRVFHGFHVHANDVPANGAGCVADPAQPASSWFVSADGHFTKPGQTHGNHDGDLPTQYLDAAGRAQASFTTDHFRPADVVGRAVILHAGADNYGNVPTGEATTAYRPNSPAATDLTARTGNAGDRVACGVLSR